MTETDPFPGSVPDAAQPAIAAPAVAHPPARAARRGAGGTLFTLFLFLLLAGGLYYVWSNPKGQNDPDALDALQRTVQAQGQAAGQQTAQLAGVTQQLQALTGRVDKMEGAAGALQRHLAEVAAAQASATQAPAVQAPAPPPDLGDLRQRMDALSAKVAALAGQPASPPAAPDLGDLPERVNALAAKVAAFASQPAPAPPPADTGAALALAGLKSRVEQIEAAEQSALGRWQAQQKEALDQSEAAVLARQKSALNQFDVRLGKLEQGAGSIEDAASRAARLERVQAAVVALQAGQKLGPLAGAPPALARFADQAPPTEATLRQSFPALAAHARQVSQPDTARRTFLQRALARLQQSVTVRRGDEVLVGDPAAGVLSEAEVDVQNGDLAGAVQRLGALTGPAASAMAGWVDQARALVAARAALASLAARG